MLMLHRLNRFIICGIAFFLSSCSAIVPSNYLSASTMHAPISHNGSLKYPKIIPISSRTLNSPAGCQLLAPAMKLEAYRVGPYDGLNIIVWGHPELSTVATSSIPIAMTTSSASSFSLSTSGSNTPVYVQSNGTIYYPYVGTIHVAGLTLYQVQDILSSKLTKYLRNPQVSVQVANYRHRNIYVLGEIVKPGLQPLTDKPLTMMEALSNAGGLDLNSSDPSHIFLIRGSFNNPQIFWLDATTPQALMIAQQILLKENDILYVTAATFSGFNRAINQILPTVNSYIIAKGLIDK